MKSFKRMIVESDYMRFLKKNKNLSNDQRKEINKYFSITNKQAGQSFGREYDWQSSKVRSMKYDDFIGVKLLYVSGRKNNDNKDNIKCPTNLKGLTKDVDYINIRLKNKKYCAYIPLSWKTARKFNTNKVIGSCSGNWCIGSTVTSSEWDKHVINGSEIPIYVVDGNYKWVVMVHVNIKKWDVWDSNNDSPHGIIPDLDIKKELLSSQLISLYMDIRNKYYIPKFSSQRYHQNTIDKFNRTGNTLIIETDNEDTSIMDWFINNIDYRNIKNCEIRIDDQGVYINGGIISGGNYIDKEALIEIIGTEINDGYFDFSNYKISSIDTSYIIGGNFNSCRIYGSEINNGLFTKCEIKGGDLFGGNFIDCDVGVNKYYSGTFNRCHIAGEFKSLKVIIKYIYAINSDINRCVILNGKYKNVMFGTSEILGGDYDNKCEYSADTIIKE